jgi:hypothetical protein
MADPFTLGAGIVGGLGSLLGGIFGGDAAAGDRERALKAAEMAMEEIRKTGLPPDLSAPIFFKYFQKAGVLTPEMEQALSLGQSEVAGITEDPTLKSAQMDALSMLSERARTGLTAEDRYAVNKVRDQIAADQNSKIQQILMNAQQRGQGGSGAMMAAQMRAASTGANEMSRAGDALLAQASQRALQAAQSSGDLSGRMRAQDFNVANTKAQAADQFKRFDLQNRMAVNQRNIDRKNDASRYNLNMDQAVSNANTQLTNQEMLRQREAQRQRWQDELNWRSQIGNAGRNMVDAYNQSADRKANQGYGVGSAFNQMAQGVGQWFGQDNQQKFEADQRQKDRDARYYSQGRNTPQEDDAYNSWYMGP